MATIEYSPYPRFSQPQTERKQTTSYKKYPTNKYLSYEDPTDVKQKLFAQKDCSVPKTVKQNHSVFFQNPKIKQILNRQQKDFINQNLSYHRLSKPQKVINSTHQKIDRSKNSLRPTKRHKKPQEIKKSSNAKKARTKSCQFIFKKVDNKYELSKEQRQQLQMYKKLCVTLRKQNQELSSRIGKQEREQEKFGCQIQSLKQKIARMYDYCIEKNKSNRNVDVDLQNLIRKHSKKDNKKSRDQQKQNISFSSRNVSKNNAETLCGYRQSKLKEESVKSMKKTFETNRTLRDKFETLNLKDLKNQRDKQSTRKSIVDSYIKKSSQPTLTKDQFNFKATDFAQKDEDTEVQIPMGQEKGDTNDQYKQFFSTFVKSLQIFQTNSSTEQKRKSKLLKQGGYYVQWAKQQWLEIVQYLIKKGYVSGESVRNNPRNSEADHRRIR